MMTSLKIMIAITLLSFAGCEESVEPIPSPANEKKVFERNAIDAAGVAEGDEKVSPFGRPSH